MSKQNSKQSKVTQELMRQVATQASAWVLTAVALTAATEKLHHIDMGHAAPGTHTAHAGSNKESFRNERVKETPRILEEYDVGLRMPAISGG